MIVVLLGPPGAGKGTQAQELAVRYHWSHLSTGDLLREAVAEGAPLGREAENYMKQGALVPDRLILDLLRDRLNPSLATGSLLDGFPRNLSQALELEQDLQHQGTKVDIVISLEVPEDVLVRRLTSRRVCARCQRVYNLLTKPSSAGERCESCGGELVQRPDDQELTIRKRLAVYREDTEPLKAHYDRQNILRMVPGDGAPDEVAERIELALGIPRAG